MRSLRADRNLLKRKLIDLENHIRGTLRVRSEQSAAEDTKRGYAS